MKVESVSISQIKRYGKNPRKNEKAVEYVANSIKEFGWQQPIVVDKDYVIIAGDTRYLAAIELGIEEIPVVVASELSEEQVKKFRIADNKTAEVSEWNYMKLATEILGLDNMEDFGFDFSEIDKLEGLANDINGFDGSAFIIEEDDDDEPYEYGGTSIYTPVYEPQTGKSSVTEKDVEKKADQMASERRNKGNVIMRRVICPHCGEEFNIDE